MGLSLAAIGGYAFIGAVIGGASGAGIAYHTGGDPIKGGLFGAAAGGLSGAAGGAIFGPAGGIAGAAEGATSALGPTMATGGYLTAAPTAASVGSSASSLYGGIGSFSNAFLDPVVTGIGSKVATSATPGAIGESAGGFPWQELIKPGIELGGQVASAVMQPDAPDYISPIAPPLMTRTEEEGRLAEQSPTAVDELNTRRRETDASFAQARAAEERKRVSAMVGARGSLSPSLDTHYRKPRTAKERLIGIEPTIGAAR